MDPLEVLQILQAGQGGAANPEDILSFQQNIAARNPWRMAAAPVLGTKFDTRNWSPGASIATAAGQAFLGTALNAIGQQREQEQLQALSGALPSLYANPLQAQAPEGVDPAAFDALRSSAFARKTASRDKQLEEFAKELWGARMAGTKAEETKRGEKRAEIEARQNMMQGGIADPDDPFEKKAVELRKEFAGKEAVQNYEYVSRLSNQLLETMKNPSAVADPILAKMVVQFVEPKLAVNAGEAAGLAQSTSIPEAWKGEIAQALEGKSKILQPQVKEGLINIAKSAFKAHGDAYRKVYEQASKETARYGLPIDRVLSAGAPITFESILEKTGQPLMPGKDELILEAAKLKSENPTLGQADIANMLRNKYQK